jgi:hypothetical protein
MVSFCKDAWEKYALEGNPLAIEIKPEKSTRSRAQNKYYWRLLHQLEEDAWIEGRQYTAEIWHEFLKRRFLGVVDLPCGGTTAQSTSSLTVSEFQQYVTQVEVWAAQNLGIVWIDHTCEC